MKLREIELCNKPTYGQTFKDMEYLNDFVHKWHLRVASE